MMEDSTTTLLTEFKEWIDRELPRATGYEIDLCFFVWIAATDNAAKKMINYRIDIEDRAASRDNAAQRGT